MNAETKKFLKVFLGGSFIIWLVVAALFGPGDLSCSYRREFKEDHDRYLQIVKSVPYKRYLQRPDLIKPGVGDIPESLARDVAFVEEYTQRPQFRSENFRSWAYTTFFSFFNAALVVWLAWRLGKAPLLKFIDDKIHELRDKVAAVRNAREAAAARMREAQTKLEHMAEDENRVQEETKLRLENEMRELDEAHRRRLEIMTRELEDRKAEEEHAALMQLKAELVNRAVDELLQACEEKMDDRLRASLVDGFTADMEKQFS